MIDSTAIATGAGYTALVESQRRYFAGGATLRFDARRAALSQLRQALISSEQPLLAALHTDLHKSPHEAYAAEIAIVISEIDYALKHLKSWMKPRRKSTPWAAWPSRAKVAPRPLGVSLIIGPWNYPVQLVLLPLIGAIAAGDCAVVKPSEMSPKTSGVIADMLSNAFPPEFIACVQGDRGVAEALLDEKFDKIFFTGSSAAGRAVAVAAAKQLTPVTLELGGKCPVIVAPDANIPVAAKRIIWAKTMNAGQTCVAPDYLLVHKTVRSRLIEEMTLAIKSMYGDDPSKSPHYGRIVNQRHFQRLTGYLDEVEIITGGLHDAADLYIAPTLIGNISESGRLMDEEIFGPVLPIISYEQDREALDIIRGKPAPLAVYIFSAGQSLQSQVEAEIRCGGICVNDLVVQLFGKELPFGGVGDSGMGSYHGKASFDCFTHYQTVLNCSNAIDPPYRYSPPALPLRRYKQVLPWLLRW